MKWKEFGFWAWLGLSAFLLLVIGLRWFGLPAELAYWLGWWASLLWAGLWAWIGGMGWRAREFERRVAQLRREFEAAQDLTRLEVYLHQDKAPPDIRYLVPSGKQGVPLLNGVRVLRELDHAASLLAQGRNWSYRETQLERPQYLALRDLLVEKRFLYPLRARQPVRWTADRDGGGLALLETAATSLAHTGVARHLRALRAPASTPHACAGEHSSL